MATIDDRMRTRQRAAVTVKIAELKNRLSHYLRRVQRGESILLCDRDRVIARVERAGTPAPVPGDDAEWVGRLPRGGGVRRGTRPPSREMLARPAPPQSRRGGAPLQERA